MRAGDNQCSHQQGGHEPECVKKNRVFFLVVMCGMGQIPGKLPMRSGMTLAAGPNNVGPRKRGTLLFRGQNIVGSVTIITLCRRGKAQFRYLSVESIEIRFGYFFVTAAALAVNIQAKISFVGPRDRMRLMTIITTWQMFFSIGYKGRVNAALELFINSLMAIGAGLRDIVFVNARSGVGGRQGMMSLEKRRMNWQIIMMNILLQIILFK